MALITKDGFDYWGFSGTPIHSDYTFSDTGGAIATASSYSFMGGLPVYGTGKMMYLLQNAVTVTRSFTAGDTFIMGFHFRIRGNDGAHEFLRFRDAGTTQLKFVVNTSLYIEAYRNTTLLGTSSAPISLERWHYLEFKFTIHNSTGSVAIRIDETSVLSLTGQDTQNTGNATVDSFQWIAAAGNYSGREMGLDNFYLLDDSGATLNDFLGEQRIVLITPNAAGTTTNFTPLSGANYTNVDETSQDGDSTYVESSTSGHYDLYNAAAVGASGTINVVSIITVAKKTDVGAVSIKNAVRQNSVNYDGASNALTSSYVFYTENYFEDPDTTSAWNAAGVDALQIGVKIV